MPGLAFLAAAATRALDLLLLPLCLACDETVGGMATLCANSWPHPVHRGSPVRKLRRAVRHSCHGWDAMRRMPDTNTALSCGARAGCLDASRRAGDLLADADALVRVPLHRWRRFHRRYNQAALLARCLAPDMCHAKPRVIARKRNSRKMCAALLRRARLMATKSRARKSCWWSMC